MANLTVENYKSDTLYPKVCDAMNAILSEADVVSPILVLQKMGLVTAKEIDDWRKGRIPFLEKVIKCNLSRSNRVLRLMRFHAHDLNMKPSITVYKGNSKLLRFSKTGDTKIEEAYSMCFVMISKKRGRSNL